MGDVVTMEITYWPHGKNQKPMTRTEEGFVIYREVYGNGECLIHMLNPYTDLKTRRTLTKTKDVWKCSWLGDMEHQVAVAWHPLIEFRQPR
jgi:hypothetical protein